MAYKVVCRETMLVTYEVDADSIANLEKGDWTHVQTDEATHSVIVLIEALEEEDLPEVQRCGTTRQGAG